MRAEEIRGIDPRNPDSYIIINREIAAQLADLNETGAPADKKPRLPVGVSPLITERGAVLLGERISAKAGGLWSTPGGRLEEDESILDCAKREAFEESGLQLSDSGLRVIAWREHFRFGEHYIMFYVHAPVFSGSPVLKEPDKCKGWVWHLISDIDPSKTTEPADVLALLRAETESDEAARNRRVFAKAKADERLEDERNRHIKAMCYLCREGDEPNRMQYGVYLHDSNTAPCVATPIRLLYDQVEGEAVTVR